MRLKDLSSNFNEVDEISAAISKNGDKIPLIQDENQSVLNKPGMENIPPPIPPDVVMGKTLKKKKRSRRAKQGYMRLGGILPLSLVIEPSAPDSPPLSIYLFYE